MTPEEVNEKLEQKIAELNVRVFELYVYIDQIIFPALRIAKINERRYFAGLDSQRGGPKND